MHNACMSLTVRSSERHKFHLQISSQFLFVFQGLEKGFKVAFAKATGALAFDDLKENCWAIDDRFGEDLQQVALVVMVYEDAEFGQVFDILSDVADTIQHVFIVIARRLQEFYAALLQITYGGDDIAGIDGDVLHTGTVVEFQVLFDL